MGWIDVEEEEGCTCMCSLCNVMIPELSYYPFYGNIRPIPDVVVMKDGMALEVVSNDCKWIVSIEMLCIWFNFNTKWPNAHAFIVVPNSHMKASTLVG